MTSPDNHEPKVLSVADFAGKTELLGPYGTWPYLERRLHNDRRASKTKLFSRFILHGNRLGGRRFGESHNQYVDRYQRSDLWIGLVILLLNVLDAAFTIDYLDGDLNREANPFARLLLTAGMGWFVFSKAVVVALCTLFLLVHKTFRYVRPAMYFLLAFYGALLVYHLYLQFELPLPSALSH